MQFVSDIHLESFKKDPLELVESLIRTGTNTKYLALIGDIAPIYLYYLSLKRFLWVPGKGFSMFPS